MRRSNRRALVGLICCLLSPVVEAQRAQAQEAAPRLDTIQLRAAQLTFRATGTDPFGPRGLVLWRAQDGTFHRVTEGQSQQDGSFDFGEIPIPLSEGSFHVVPLGQSPEGSRPLQLQAPLPAPQVFLAGVHILEIWIVPALYQGELQIRDEASGSLLLRRAIEPHQRGALSFDLSLEGLTSQTDTLSIEQRLDDGRQSDSTRWSLIGGRRSLP